VIELQVLTGKEAIRHELYVQNLERLEVLAWRAMHIRGLKPREFFVICINVDDPAWTDLAQELMPGHDWQEYRDRGETPVARGSVDRASVGGYLAHVCPAIAPALMNPDVSEKCIQVVVLDAGGAAVYEVVPRAEPS
jgi:hypothetical protein